MSLKIKFNNQIHMYNGSSKHADLLRFIETSFNKLPASYMLYYQDTDGDNITISCDEDIQALKETCEGTPKIFITEDLALSCGSSEEFQQILEKEEEIEQKNNFNQIQIEQKLENENYGQDRIECSVCTYLNEKHSENCAICMNPMQKPEENNDDS